MSVAFRFLVALLIGFSLVATTSADDFERYTNKVLTGIPKAKQALKVETLTTGILAEYAGVLKNVSGALVIAKTKEGRWCRLLVSPAGQKIDDSTILPILQIDRFTTFREGTDQAIHSEGKNVRLFDGFRFNLDIGQVVPKTVPADLEVICKDGKIVVNPLGKCECYVLTSVLPEVASQNSTKPEIGKTFDPKFFSGTYQLFDDGRRSGKLTLKVVSNGNVDGFYYSDKDGRKYEVSGKIGEPNHTITFRITYPRSVQLFRGFLFTGDGAALTGSATLQQRETGFYAIRQ